MFDAAPLPNASLTFEDVSFSRGERQLFNGLSFSLHAGQLLWVLGDNGIGKTSILELAVGFHRPNQGNISYLLDSKDSQPDECLSYIGHLDAFEPLLSAEETLEFWADVYNAQEPPAEILARVGLSEQAKVRTKGLSAGQKRRLALARLFMSNRPIWIMDEPKAAMDQSGQELIAALLSDHIKRGGSALIASHYDASAIGRDARILRLQAA